MLDSVTVIEQEASCATSVPWCCLYLHHLSTHLSAPSEWFIFIVNSYVIRCTCILITICLHSLWTPSVWHPLEPLSTRSTPKWWQRCVKNCEEVMGLMWDWLKMLDKGWDTVVPWLSFISLSSSWQWESSFSSVMSAIRHPSGQMMWGNTFMIYLITVQKDAFGTKETILLLRLHWAALPIPTLRLAPIISCD